VHLTFENDPGRVASALQDYQPPSIHENVECISFFSPLKRLYNRAMFENPALLDTEEAVVNTTTIQFRNSGAVS